MGRRAGLFVFGLGVIVLGTQSAIADLWATKPPEPGSAPVLDYSSGVWSRLEVFKTFPRAL